MKSKDGNEVKPHGELRSSQLLTSYGPGAMVDLPRHAVLIAGLDHWRGADHRIREPRLEAWLQRRFQEPRELRALPVALSDDDPPYYGVQAFIFPLWFISEVEEDVPALFRRGTAHVRARRLVHQRETQGGKLKLDDRRTLSLSPVRFVQACVNGHIDDIDWRLYVHNGPIACSRALWLEEVGTSGDLADLYVSCECGARRSMKEATHREGHAALGYCRGARPWLGRGASEECRDGTGRLRNRLLIRSASDAYFSQVVSVIHIPELQDPVAAAVGKVWELVKNFPTLEMLSMMIPYQEALQAAFAGLEPPAVFAAIERRRIAASHNGAPTVDQKSIKQVEIETFQAVDPELGSPLAGSTFFARRLVLDPARRGVMAQVERVVLLPRMLEVKAMLGFTRFEASTPDIDSELDLPINRSEIAREVKWLPAVENRGEGVFLELKPGAVKKWLDRPEVQKRKANLLKGFEAWKIDQARPGDIFPGVETVLLHSLSHLLISAIALECGYPASSIRERIYAGSYGYGILLYTASSDSAGTLGGLVQVGLKLERHLLRALEMAQLCSNDPVCASHNPAQDPTRRYLQGAACHGCLYIAEPSCERRNDFLDRSLVVGGIEPLGAEFFRDEDL